MNKKEVLKEIMELSKVEVINPISTMSSINVDDLMSAVDRLNKIPDYNDLLKENQELKKQLEEINKMIEKCGFVNIEQVMLNYCGLLTQQKYFINYLEDEIQQQETIIAENQEKSYFLIYEDEKENLKLSSQKAYIRKVILEEILQKYKEIIGYINDKK